MHIPDDSHGGAHRLHILLQHEDLSHLAADYFDATLIKQLSLRRLLQVLVDVKGVFIGCGCVFAQGAEEEASFHF